MPNPSEIDPETMRNASQPPKPDNGGRHYGSEDPLVFDKARTGDDALKEYLERSGEYTPKEFDKHPAFLRRKNRQ